MNTELFARLTKLCKFFAKAHQAEASRRVHVIIIIHLTLFPHRLPAPSLGRAGEGVVRAGEGASLHHLLAIDDIQATAIHGAYLAAVDVIDGF